MKITFLTLLLSLFLILENCVLFGQPGSIINGRYYSKDGRFSVIANGIDRNKIIEDKYENFITIALKSENGSELAYQIFFLNNKKDSTYANQNKEYAFKEFLHKCFLPLYFEKCPDIKIISEELILEQNGEDTYIAIFQNPKAKLEEVSSTSVESIFSSEHSYKFLGVLLTLKGSNFISIQQPKFDDALCKDAKEQLTHSLLHFSRKFVLEDNSIQPSQHASINGKIK